VQLIVTKAGMEAIGTAGWAGLTNPRVDLFTAYSGLLDANTVWTQLTIAAFTGYAGPITVTISAQYVSQPSNLPAVDISDAIFNGPSSGSGVNVIGMVFHDTTATPVVYAVALFDGPASLNVPLDRVSVDETMLLNVGLQVQLTT
jgi:hypothetical protein